MNATIQFQKLPESKQINVKHSYPHPLETLWDAFTKTEMLEKWWAPLPYKAKVVTNHFEKGQRLLYYMAGPEGERHYCIVEYLDIHPLKSFTILDAFSDENGAINTDLPQMKWQNNFSFENGITTITNILNFDNPEDMSKILEMKFEEGYRTALNQLFDLLNQK